jgi:hypothetical protein
MSESADLLDAQMTAITEAQDNLGGLIEKCVGIQSELESGDFGEFAGKMSEPFTALSMAAENLRDLHHTMELERNRIRNEEE